MRKTTIYITAAPLDRTLLGKAVTARSVLSRAEARYLIQTSRPISCLGPDDEEVACLVAKKHRLILEVRPTPRRPHVKPGEAVLVIDGRKGITYTLYTLGKEVSQMATR